MEVIIDKGDDGRYSVQFSKVKYLHYFNISFLSYLIVGILWQLWELNKYGEIRPDSFDGAVLLLLSLSLSGIAFAYDVIKHVLEGYIEAFEENEEGRIEINGKSDGA